MTEMDVKQVVADTANRRGLDPNLMIRVAEIESRLNPRAVNRSSGAAGLFQFLPGLWSSYGLTASTVFDAAANADAAARKMLVAAKYLRDRGIAVEPWMLYLAHQQGNYGASVILDAARRGLTINELPTSPANIRRNVLANIPSSVSLTTVAAFVEYWRSKLGLPTVMATTSTPSTPRQTQQQAERSFTQTQWILAGLATTAALYTVGRITNVVPRIGPLP